MKRFATVLIMVLAMLSALPTLAAVTESFDGLTQTAYGTYTYNNFVLTNALCSNAGSNVTCGNPLPSNAVRLRNAAGTSLEYVGLDGNGKDGGVGVISFDYKSWDNDPAAVYEISCAINEPAYTILDTISTTQCTPYQQYSYTLNSAADNIKILIRTVAGATGERLHIDNFSITDFGSGPGESDAHVFVSGPGASATISSLVDTYAESQLVFTFGVQDDGSGAGSLNTIINGISINQGNANTCTNWTQFIAGAELSDGSNAWLGTVNTASLTFVDAPLALLLDGGAAVEFELRIWLTAALPFWADNEILEFHVDSTSFTVATGSASFDPLDPPVESGDTNNRIDIVGTQLGITTQPPAVACRDQAFTVRAGFTDANNGIDEDYPSEAITLSVNTGMGVLSAVSGLTKLSTSGQSAWTDLKYSVVETGVILQAVSTTYPTPVLTNAFDVTNCASIVVDAMPTCWDADTSDQAVPFVVHISIRDWTAYAGQQVYVKVYDGGANPWHYTAGSGWSRSTSYLNVKPIVTLDANGNWSGWLPVKSKGLYKFKPRAALVSGTSTNITGDEVQGTLLDLSAAGNGAILEDRNGNSNTDPGNTVLIRNGGGTIIGAYLAEDNTLPLDDGGSPIVAGGWRIAVCTFCNEDVTYESWAPETWPRNGEPERTDIESNICIYPGDVREVHDVNLPVELLSFTATAGDHKVDLAWRTASETDNDYFALVRDGEELVRVPSAGEAGGYAYAWTDESAENGVTYRYTLAAVDLSGARSELETVEATPSEISATVTEYALYQNYPNPFNPVTTIRFDLLESGLVSLTVFNVMGQEVAAVVNGSLPAGAHSISFDARDLPSGVYLYRLNVNGFSAEKKMLLMK